MEILEMENLEMEKGSNFVEILAGFRGCYGWDRSAATINSELFPLKTEAQAIRYGYFTKVLSQITQLAQKLSQNQPRMSRSSEENNRDRTRGS